MSKELKNGNEILVGQAVFKFWIKTVKILSGSTTQKGIDNFEKEHKHANFLGRRCSTPLNVNCNLEPKKLVVQKLGS